MDSPELPGIMYPYLPQRQPQGYLGRAIDSGNARMIREIILCPCHKQPVKTVKKSGKIKYFCTVEEGRQLFNFIRTTAEINLADVENNHEDFKKKASGE